MIIKPLASSSAGNCTIIEENGQQLIIDAGISPDRIRREIGGFDKVVGCLVSHGHGDHAGCVEQLKKQTAFPIYDKFRNKGFYRISGVFMVRAMLLKHDVDCYGFLVLTKSSKFFYATDTASIPYTFPGLTHCAIEANFDFKLIAESEMNDFVVQRTINSHLDIDSAIEFIKRHPTLQEIWLLHLSDRHSNAEDFRNRVIDETGVIVEIARK